MESDRPDRFQAELKPAVVQTRIHSAPATLIHFLLHKDVTAADFHSYFSAGDCTPCVLPPLSMKLVAQEALSDFASE
jgi:hypothetical protein